MVSDYDADRTLTIRSKVAPIISVFLDLFNACARAAIESPDFSKKVAENPSGWTSSPWLSEEYTAGYDPIAPVKDSGTLYRSKSIDKQILKKNFQEATHFLYVTLQEYVPHLGDCRVRFGGNGFSINTYTKKVSSLIGKERLRKILAPFNHQSPSDIGRVLKEASRAHYIFAAAPQTILDEANTTMQQVCTWITMRSQTAEEAVSQLSALMKPSIKDPRSNRDINISPVEFLAFAPNGSIGSLLNKSFPTHVALEGTIAPSVRQVSDENANPFSEEFITFWAASYPKGMGCPFRHRDQIDHFHEFARIYIQTAIAFIEGKPPHKQELQATAL